MRGRLLHLASFVLAVLLSCEQENACPDLFWYEDADGDGYGNMLVKVAACSAPDGYVDNDQDCNDLFASIYPGAPEICDNDDNNCNSEIDEEDDCADGFDCVSGECIVLPTWYEDRDGDGFGNPDNFIKVLEQPLGFVADNTDCDDTRTDVYPGALEVCNGLDDNCDGLVDEEPCPAGYFCDGEEGCKII